MLKFPQQNLLKFIIRDVIIVSQQGNNLFQVNF